ncbi:hypothetical protein BVRB_7g164750 [Beta vulgaris subsp. vulgaris]|nr:hypothetical protein BVRB_7g164750 [Beta vulgaris subsp. vulgaris]
MSPISSSKLKFQVREEDEEFVGDEIFVKKKKVEDVWEEKRGRKMELMVILMEFVRDEKSVGVGLLRVTTIASSPTLEGTRIDREARNVWDVTSGPEDEDPPPRLEHVAPLPKVAPLDNLILPPSILSMPLPLSLTQNRAGAPQLLGNHLVGSRDGASQELPLSTLSIASLC